ncbi:MAG: diacylglycerol/lipid kinase family protein [Minisyncoccales bacterium]
MPEYDFTKYFENIFGIEFNAKAVREFRRMKFNQSKFCYFLVAIQEIFNYKEVTLKMNGVESDFFEIVIGNGKREGGLFKISKQPNPLTDNSLDLTVIRSASKIKRIFYILTATLGMLQNCKEVEYKKITDIELETKDNLLTHIDGSLLFLPPGKIKVSVVPKALKVIQPAVI